MFSSKSIEKTLNNSAEAYLYQASKTCAVGIESDRHFLLNNVNIYDTINKKMEDINLSLILVMKTDKGIVFSTDSKSTIVNQNGWMQEECNREAEKLFLTENFAVATHGNNRVVVQGITVYIEDAIKSILSHSPQTPNDFIRIFRTECKESFIRHPDIKFNFVFGYKNKSRSDFYGYVVESVGILAGNEERFLYYDNGMYAFGYGDIIPANIIPQANIILPLDVLKNRLEKAIKGLIMVGDALLGYNPVGGKIITEIWKDGIS